MKPIFSKIERSKIVLTGIVAFLALVLGVSFAISPKPVNRLPDDGGKDMNALSASYLIKGSDVKSDNPFNGFKGFVIVQNSDGTWSVSR
jgi:hypothetical protein